VSEAFLIRSLEMAESQLRSQKDDLRSLRSQSQFVLSASSLIAAFFGTFVGSIGEAGALTLNLTDYQMQLVGLAIFVFLLSMVCGAMTATSWSAVEFELNPSRISYAVNDDKEVVEDVVSNLIDKSQKIHEQNERVLDRVKCTLVMGFFLAMLQVPIWIAALFWRAI
jgi:hypothetical protein